jgi:hypothetical protein
LEACWQIENEETHNQLLSDLVEHQWQLFWGKLSHFFSHFLCVVWTIHYIPDHS